MNTNGKSDDEIIKKASEKLGISGDEIKKAAEGGGKNLLDRLSEKDRKKVSDILDSPERTKEILSSPKAQEILRKFFGEK